MTPLGKGKGAKRGKGEPTLSKGLTPAARLRRFYVPLTMSRLALVLASLSLAGCAGSSPWAGGSAQSGASEVTPPVATAPVAPSAPVEGEGTPTEAPRYSWQKKEQTEAASPDAPKTGAPERDGYVRVQAIRPEHALIALAFKQKPDDGATLQLTKESDAILIRVVRSNDETTIADILPVQNPAKLRKFLDGLTPGDEVLCGAPAEGPGEGQ